MSKKFPFTITMLTLLGVMVVCLLFTSHTYKIKTLDSAYIKAKTQSTSNTKESVLNKFNLEDVNGKSFNMGIFNGKKVVLIYWKYNCDNCLSMTPAIGYLYQLSLERQDLVVVRVSDLEYKENTINTVNERVIL